MSLRLEASAKTLTMRQAGVLKGSCRKKNVVSLCDPAWLKVFIAKSSRWPVVVDSVIFAFGVS